MSIKTERIGSSFVKEISYIIMTEIKDPNIKNITITDCDVTNDLSYAKVYFTVLDPTKKEISLKSLNNAANFIELELSKKVDIRKMPQISFHYDESIAYGEKIEQKIKEIMSKEHKNNEL